MSATLVRSWNPADKLDEIFFESSSKKDFKDAQEKKDFHWKYLGFYLKYFSDYAWVVCQDEVPVGYCIGMPQSRSDLLYDIQPHMKLFEPYFKDYPAHYHVNCLEEVRGQGLGAYLVHHFMSDLIKKKVTGVHIITSSDSRNTSFYRRLGHDFEAQKSHMLFLGKRLTGLTQQT